MREVFLVILSAVFGWMVAGWAVWVLLPAKGNKAKSTKFRPIPKWAAWILLFIGLADAAKATRDLVLMMWQ